jgi:flagellar basal body-associated protein FliL
MVAKKNFFQMYKQLIIDIIKVIISAAIGGIVTFFVFLAKETKENCIIHEKQQVRIENVEIGIHRIAGDYTPRESLGLVIKNQESKFEDIYKTMNRVEGKLDRIESILMRDRVMNSIHNKLDSGIVWCEKTIIENERHID